MIRFPIYATTRRVTLSVLATLFTLGLAGQTFAQSTDPGFITAKTWKDNANPTHPYAIGDGNSDDTQNLQDMINYAVANAETIKLEPGDYKITKTLMIQNPPQGQHYGFRMSGIAGPAASGTAGYRSGVTISLVTSDASQLAVLEVGAGVFVAMTFENLGLDTSVNGVANSVVTKYGLLFAGQNFTHAKLDMINVLGVDTAYAIDVVPGVPAGGNGEDVNLTNCHAAYCNCFYLNNSPAGQALAHNIFMCGFGLNNGGTVFRLGPNAPGLGLHVEGISGTFGTGPLRNTLIECWGSPSYANISGGRIEFVDTIIRYAGGSTGCMGHVTVRGMDLGGVGGTNNPAFPIIDDLLNNQDAMQYTNTIEHCRIDGISTLTIGTAPNFNDLSKNYFDRCTFTNFKNNLTDPSNQAYLKRIGAVVRDCRSAPAGSNSLYSDMNFPLPPAPVVEASYGNSGNPWPIPGKIEAENYDVGGEGLAYHDIDPQNQGGAYRTDGVDIVSSNDTGGGYQVGFTAVGEWLNYTVGLTNPGHFTCQVRTSSGVSGGMGHIEVDGVNVSGSIAFPNTGSWNTYTTLSIPNIYLPFGKHTMRFYWDTGGPDINWFNFVQTGP